MAHGHVHICSYTEHNATQPSACIWGTPQIYYNTWQAKTMVIQHHPKVGYSRVRIYGATETDSHTAHNVDRPCAFNKSGNSRVRVYRQAIYPDSRVQTNTYIILEVYTSN